MTGDAGKAERARELFDLVVQQDVRVRSQFLNVVAMYDPPEIRRAVEELLTAECESHTPPESPPGMEPIGSVPLLVGQHSAYSIVRHIGNGAIGAVYEAVRTGDENGPPVAVKLVHRCIGSGVAPSRFVSELQMLTRLEHRNIAAILDCGVTADGRPFLVTEFVDGIPITRWCDARRASIESRLSLFLQVCAGVHHAHANGSAHLDLRPANILVASDGTVRILDFGVARLAAGGAGESMPAFPGATRPFSPEYASPEYLRGEPLTAAADVYSLGVVLFELLAGRRPYSARTVANTGRIVPDESIPKPGAVATGEAATRSGEADQRRLRDRLRGDLDSIVTMALRHEPARRYQSAEALRADIEAFLARRPVTAVPASVRYSARMYARRNTNAIAFASMTLVALAAWNAWTVHEARHGRVPGESGPATAPSGPKGGGASLPVLRPPETTRPSEQALSVLNHSLVLLEQGRCRESVSRSREVLALRGNTLPESDATIAASLETLGRCLDRLGRHAEAARALHESLELREKYAGEESWLIANSRGVLGEHYMLVRKYDRAESLLLGAERMLAKTVGADDPRTQANARRLVALYDALGEDAMADVYRAKTRKSYR